MKRSKFSLSNYKLFTANMGELIPIQWFEALPGDTIQQRTNALVRLSPMLAPIMHPVVVRIHHWFVPNRLLWDDFEDFITGGSDGNDTTTAPYRAESACTEGSLQDYFGLPVSAGYGATLNVSALPFRAYALIYNEFYRDQDLVTELTASTANGADTTTNTTIQKVSWEKDYFTTARPWEQKGTDINIPLSGEAPVTGIAPQDQTYRTGPKTVYETDGSASTTYAKFKQIDHSTGQDAVHVEEDPNNLGYPNIRADLTQATGISANELRLYMALQRYKEARAEYGSRYVEYLQTAFGVRSSDARLQNPEYLGGGRQVISFSEVLSTADSGTDVVGTLRGHGVSAMRTNRYRRFFEEHGIVMSMMSVIPKAMYTDGVEKKWSRTTKEDYFQKELAAIGDEAILNKEVYADHTTPAGTFGYQQRYDSYRQIQSGIAGEFNSSLNHWHYARTFSSDPSLNQTFIECNPTKRQYADNASDVLYVMANNSVQARRTLPYRPKKRLM